MKGRDHLLISLLSLGILVVPVAESLPPAWIVAIAIGLGIGALAPDADAEDAAIFHASRAGPLGAAVPIVGYTLRYLCYYPLALALRVLRGDRDALRHRGLLHSMAGVAASTLFVTAGLAAIMLYFALAPLPLLLLTGCAFAAGALLHLLEDTCTVSGVAWVYPYRISRYCGTIRTGDAGDFRPILFEGLLAAGLAGIVVAPSVYPSLRMYLPGIGAVFLCALWIVFLAASKVRRRAGGCTDGRRTSYL